MKNYKTIIGSCLLMFAGLQMPAHATERLSYESLKGIPKVDMAYDFRMSEPAKAAMFLEFIYLTSKDEDLAGLEETSRFALIFSNKAITLVSKDWSRFAEEDHVHLQRIVELLKQMEERGIWIEGCTTAAKLFNLDPKEFYDEINPINNAWISLAGYEAGQFSIIPIY